MSAATHRPLLIKLSLAVVGMFGFGFAMVPLYDVFCEVTGLNGKTGATASTVTPGLVEDASRTLTVEFDTSLNESMNLSFSPAQRSMQVHPGRMYTTTFYAHNDSGRPMVGQAIPSIVPGPAAAYFKKTECFCFTRQEFATGEGRDMPVTFYVEPGLPADVGRITLSYTFFDVTAQAVN